MLRACFSIRLRRSSLICAGEVNLFLVVQVEVLAVGDELCYGRVYDVNSYWLADQVTRLGGFVKRITCVRDSVEEICGALREMLSRSPSFILVTGGLGPTVDDLTLEALSKLTGKRVIVDEHILDVMCGRRGLDKSQLQERHLRMSSTLEGAKCLPNPVGWAPLTIVDMEKASICLMPGPPREVQACFAAHLAPEVERATHRHSVAGRVAARSSESEISPLLISVQRALGEIYMKPLLSEYVPGGELPIEVVVFGADEADCRKRYAEALGMLAELARQAGKEIRAT